MTCSNGFGVCKNAPRSFRVQRNCRARGARICRIHTLHRSCQRPAARRARTRLSFDTHSFSRWVFGPFTRAPRRTTAPPHRRVLRVRCAYVHTSQKPQIKSHTRASAHRRERARTHAGFQSDSGSKVQSRWQVRLPLWEKCTREEMHTLTGSSVPFHRYAHGHLTQGQLSDIQAEISNAVLKREANKTRSQKNVS